MDSVWEFKTVCCQRLSLGVSISDLPIENGPRLLLDKEITLCVCNYWAPLMDWRVLILLPNL
jgi:hypothetical protein